jgi:hypothetical protein
LTPVVHGGIRRRTQTLVAQRGTTLTTRVLHRPCRVVAGYGRSEPVQPTTKSPLWPVCRGGSRPCVKARPNSPDLLTEIPHLRGVRGAESAAVDARMIGGRAASGFVGFDSAGSGAEASPRQHHRRPWLRPRQVPATRLAARRQAVDRAPADRPRLWTRPRTLVAERTFARLHNRRRWLLRTDRRHGTTRSVPLARLLPHLLAAPRKLVRSSPCPA